jgi:twitching motility two-component system response regulator PilH
VRRGVTDFQDLTVFQGAKIMSISRILVVDDSPTERFFLSELLVKNGYLVSMAESGEEAVAQAKQTLPDLIVMDVVMPGMNGYQATRMISKEDATKHIPVIMCTTKGQETDKVWGMRQGAKAYLVKPVKPEDLLSQIKALG